MEVGKKNSIDEATEQKLASMLQAGHAIDIDAMRGERRKGPLSEQHRAL
jgi:hypothetical protein